MEQHSNDASRGAGLGLVGSVVDQLEPGPVASPAPREELQRRRSSKAQQRRRRQQQCHDMPVVTRNVQNALDEIGPDLSATDARALMAQLLGMYPRAQQAQMLGELSRRASREEEDDEEGKEQGAAAEVEEGEHEEEEKDDTEVGNEYGSHGSSSGGGGATAPTPNAKAAVAARMQMQRQMQRHGGSATAAVAASPPPPAKPVATWTSADVAAWLEGSSGLGAYAALFARLDGASLLAISTDQQLKALLALPMPLALPLEPSQPQLQETRASSSSSPSPSSSSSSAVNSAAASPSHLSAAAAMAAADGADGGADGAQGLLSSPAGAAAAAVAAAGALFASPGGSTRMPLIQRKKLLRKIAALRAAEQRRRTSPGKKSGGGGGGGGGGSTPKQQRPKPMAQGGQPASAHGGRSGLRRPRPRLVNLSIDPSAPKAVSTGGPVALLPSPCAALSARRMSPVEAYHAQMCGGDSPRDGCFSPSGGHGGSGSEGDGGAGGGGGGGGGGGAAEAARDTGENAPAPAPGGFGGARKGRGLGLGLAVNLQLDLREGVVCGADAGAGTVADTAGGGSGGGGAGPCSDPFDHGASYDFTEDGTLRLHGFRIKDSGISATPDGASCLMMPRHTKDCLVVLEELGQGAAGRVYKALHVPTLRLIALKVFRVHDEARRRQLVTELRCAPEGLRGAGPAAGAGGSIPIGGRGCGGGTQGRIGDRKALVASAASAELAAAIAVAAKDSSNVSGGGGDDDSNSSSNSSSSSSSSSAKMEKDSCPYLVSYFDAFCDQQKGTVSVVLEYMDAGTLQDLINAGVRCNERVLASIAHSCLRGLDHIHVNMRKLHRDIKASNVLISKGGEVKISDFGLAKDLDCTADLASTFVGTLLYMSPERIAGKPYSYASDIWSLGLTLFACAAGQLPLPVAEGYWGVVHAVQTLPPPSLASYGDFSPELRDFVAQMLSKDPAQRPSAVELLKHPFLAANYVPPTRRATPSSGQASPEQHKQLGEIMAKVREWRAQRHASAHGGPLAGGRRALHDSVDGHPLGKAPRIHLSTAHLRGFAEQCGVSYEAAFNALKDQYKFEDKAGQSMEI